MLYIPNINNVAAERTCTPLYEFYSATAYSGFLDPTQAASGIYSGMVMYRTGSDTLALLDGGLSNGCAFGISSMDANSLIDDYVNTNNNAWSAWIGGNNAFFQVLAPAFDTTASYVVPTNGTRQYLYPLVVSTITNSAVQFLGQLTSVQGDEGTAGYTPVAELIDVLGPTTINIRLVPFGSAVV